MAKMTETDAVNLLAAAAGLAAQLAVLIPTLVQNLQDVREGLASDDADALNEKIKATHGEVQALDARLQALTAR